MTETIYPIMGATASDSIEDMVFKSMTELKREVLRRVADRMVDVSFTWDDFYATKLRQLSVEIRNGEL